MHHFFPTLTPQFATLIEELQGRPLAILGHLRPDGDCIGSQVGLARVLANRGFDAVCVNKHVSPRNLRNFIGDTPYFEAQHFYESQRIALACDAADRERLGEELNTLYSDIHLCVDHHISNQGYAKVNLIDPQAAATAEILAGIFFDLEFEIDAIAAQALYVGIATDTGQFQYGGTTRRVFELAGRLLECGANPAESSAELYEQESFARMKLLQRFLSTLHLEFDGRVCIGTISSEDYAATGCTYDDTEGFVNYARSIAGVELGLLLEERDSTLKGSLRAKHPSARVDQIAGQLGGGGHACAAGFSLKSTDLTTGYTQVLETIRARIKE